MIKIFALNPIIVYHCASITPYNVCRLVLFDQLKQWRFNLQNTLHYISYDA